MMKTLMKTRPSLLILSLLAATLGLGACAPIVVGGAMVGSALVATDRRTAGTQVEDETIELKAGANIKQQLGDKVHVSVNSYNRVVLLTGEATTAEARDQAGQIAGNVENAANVINELDVTPASSLTSRSNDVLIASKIKATLFNAQDLISSAFYVVVERGNVYLMGRVTEREANRATDLIRTISGVQKVVRCFDVISEDELARIVPPKKPDPAATQPSPQ